MKTQMKQSESLPRRLTFLVSRLNKLLVQVKDNNEHKWNSIREGTRGFHKCFNGIRIKRTLHQSCDDTQHFIRTRLFIIHTACHITVQQDQNFGLYLFNWLFTNVTFHWLFSSSWQGSLERFAVETSGSPGRERSWWRLRLWRWATLSARGGTSWVRHLLWASLTIPISFVLRGLWPRAALWWLSLSSWRTDPLTPSSG